MAEKRIPVQAVVDGVFCGKKCPFMSWCDHNYPNCHLFDQALKGGEGIELRTARCSQCVDMETR